VDDPPRVIEVGLTENVDTVGAGVCGVAGSVTVTVQLEVLVPPGPRAVRTYVVVEVGDTSRDPVVNELSLMTPLVMEIDEASFTFQLSVDEAPFVIELGLAVKEFTVGFGVTVPPPPPLLGLTLMTAVILLLP
jgi:hypothetical protein